MANKTITSGQSATPVGSAGTKLYTSTKISYTLNETGQVDPKSVKTELIYYDAPLSPGVVAATKTGTDQNWTYANKPLSNNPILGKDAQKSLKEGALKTTTNQQIQQAAAKEGLTLEQTKEISSANANVTSPTDSNNPQAKFEDSVGGANALTSFGQTIGDKSVRPEYGDHSYPKPFPEKQDRVKFTMFRYSPKNLDVDNFKTGDVFGKRSQPKNNMGTVQLPITPQIQDTNTVSWGNDDMNSFAAMAASASYNIIKTGGTAIAQEAGAVATLLQSQGGNDALKKAAAAYLAGEAAGGNKSFLTRVTGALINPNTELLFNAPTLRTFGFSFTMSAREPDEAKEIKKIIRFFKQGMSVKRASTGLFLKTPNIFDIKYILGDTNKDHPWINQIKTCALTSCSVNYTPAGNYATFYDGAMSAYEMTLSFTELDPVFEDDYVSDNDATIGY
jgi:hypothetical protein